MGAHYPSKNVLPIRVEIEQRILMLDNIQRNERCMAGFNPAEYEEKEKQTNAKGARMQEGDTEIIFRINGRCLSYLLAGEGVGVIVGENIDIAITDQFLRRVGGIGNDSRSGRWFVGFVNGLDRKAIRHCTANKLPSKEGKTFYYRGIGYMECHLLAAY